MSLDTIDRGLDRETCILEEQLRNSQITTAEYNAALRELLREAREMEREELEDRCRW